MYYFIVNAGLTVIAIGYKLELLIGFLEFGEYQLAINPDVSIFLLNKSFYFMKRF